MTTKAHKTRRVMSQTETVQVARLLDRHLRKVGERLFEYSDGNSDEVIAKLVSDSLTGAHVHRLRVECYGELHKPDPNASFADKVSLMQDQIAALGQRLTELEGRVAPGFISR